MSDQLDPFEKFSFVKGKDKRIVYGSIFVVCCCLIPFTIPNWPVPFNYLIINAIPLPVVFLMCLIPLAILWGIYVGQQVKFNDRVVERVRRIERLKKGKILFRSAVQSYEGGSLWKIRNANKFDWGQVKVTIERDVHGLKEVETHKLDKISRESEKTFYSKLAPIPLCQFRVTVRCQEGSLTDFPEIIEVEIPEPGVN
jgi:hypothetical protein